MNPRFFCPGPLASGTVRALPREAAHHATGVLRLQTGAALTLFNGEGGEFEARIAALRPEVTVAVLGFADIEREAPLAITLAQVVPAGDRMDWLVQKAVELGVVRLVPLMSARSVVRLTGERAQRRVAHWRQIVIGAAEQCGRNRLMVIDAATSLPHFLAGEGRLGGLRLVMMPRSGSNLSALPPCADAASLLVGPEGGFTDGEHAAALASGFLDLRLGPRILRAETAGIAAVAALLARWGDF